MLSGDEIMNKISKSAWSGVLFSLFMLPLLGFSLNIGVNNQVNTGIITGGNCTQGDGVTRQEKRQVDFFNAIFVDGIFEVVVNSGLDQHVVVTADSNLHSMITTIVEGQKLVISTNGAICTQNPLVLEISLKELKSIAAGGSSDLSVAATNCISDAFSVDLSGTSSMKLTGNCNTFAVQLQGTSELDSSGFKAENVTIAVADATEASINVTRKLTGTSSGTSEVFYSGNPREVQVQASDVSEVSPSP